MQRLMEKSVSSGGALASDPARKTLEFLRWYAEERVNPRLQDERRSLSPAVVLDLASAGLLGLQVPREYDGLGLSHRDTYRVMTQLAAIDPNLFLTIGVHNSLGITPIQYGASEAVRRELLPPIARGEEFVTSAITEPGMGSNLKLLSTTAHRSSDGSYTVNGAKTFISLGGWARHVNVFCRLAEGGEQAGTVGLVADTRGRGFDIGPEMMTFGMRAFPQNHLSFTDLSIPARYLLGEEGRGLDVCKDAFTAGRVYLAAGGLGAMKRALQLAHRFAVQRSVATGLLSENGKTQQILSESIAAARSVELLILHLADLQDRGIPVDPSLPLTAKALGCELMWKVLDRCVQLLGGRGFLDTNILGQFFRDYRVFRIFEGATEAVSQYQGTRFLADEGRLPSLIVRDFDASPAVVALADQVVQLGRSTTNSSRHRHVLADSMGTLVCWSLLAALTSSEAKKSGQPQDIMAADWCEQSLRAQLLGARTAVSQGAELPTGTEITHLIEAYGDTIGDFDHRAAGEHHGIDPLLRRSA
ncbi:acyl-CoA dehydrogenase family protein [Kitasatospora sp. NBC_00070]|uniref:acyl-CoA dehydrogenase family protein n=1 Tax=Kitasatospora sp. NBC_00070 TaxID=2975962 RepID=UPI002F90DCD3